MSSTLDTRAFRRTVGTFATGVTVVTTMVGGIPHGMTANAFASLSLDPLLVLVCVDRKAGFHLQLQRASHFALTVLAADQEHLSRWFASAWRPGRQGQFDDVAWQPGRYSGAPLLDGGLAYLDCRLTEMLPGGDHSIVVGEVLDVGELGGDDPLLWYRGDYHRLPPD